MSDSNEEFVEWDDETVDVGNHYDEFAYSPNYEPSTYSSSDSIRNFIEEESGRMLDFDGSHSDDSSTMSSVFSVHSSVASRNSTNFLSEASVESHSAYSESTIMINYDLGENSNLSNIPSITRDSHETNNSEANDHTENVESFSKTNQNNDGEPPAKCMRVEIDEDVGDGQTCPICFDSWTSSGSHRLASLKCGHLFGKACIERWLRPRENRVCPTCKSKASEKDIRHIYARSVSFVDNSEIESIKIELEKSKSLTKKAERDAEILQTTINNQRQKISEQEKQIKFLMERKNGFSSKIIKKWNFSLEKNMDINKGGGCRVFVYNKRRNSLFISQLNTTGIFHGCNIIELDCETYSIGKGTLLHQKEIRDIAYSDHHNLVMSVSLDKKIQIFGSASEKETISIPTDVALWCCNWDICEPNRICVGGLGGNIMLYDIRQTRACLSRVHEFKDVSPVLSLACMSDKVISCSLNSLQSHHRESGENFQSEKLEITGPFYDMNYDYNNKSLVLSMRPSIAIPFCRHEVFSYDFTRQKQLGHPMQIFRNATALTQMTKSSQFQIGEDQLFSLYSETDEVIKIWNITKEKCATSLVCRDLIIDTCSWRNDSDMFLAALSNNKARIYKLCIDDS